MLKIKGLSKAEKGAIEEVKNRLVKKYGDHLLLLILYGSKARGDSHEYSDIDLLAVVDQDSWEMRDKFFDETFEVMEKYDLHTSLISTVVFDQREFEFEKEIRTNFYENLERDGIDLWKKEAK
jgi:predicted nucleotidyltransferase